MERGDAGLGNSATNEGKQKAKKVAVHLLNPDRLPRHVSTVAMLPPFVLPPFVLHPFVFPPFADDFLLVCVGAALRRRVGLLRPHSPVRLTPLR